MKKKFFPFLILWVLLCLPVLVPAQNQQEQTPPPPQEEQAAAKQQAAPQQQGPEKPKANTAIAEDVQRFLGFESPLLFRYLSLPFDSVMTVNVKFFTIDLGFLLLILLPLALFLSPRISVWSQILSLLLLTLFLIISMATVYLGNGLSPEQGLEKLQEAMGAEGSFWEHLHQQVQYFCVQLYAPLYAGIMQFSGEKDHITYPLLLGILALVLGMLYSRYRQASEEHRAILLFALLYGSFWLMLSPGLPWYGYLIFVLGPMLTVYAWTREHPSGLFPLPVQRGLLYGMVLIWMFSAFPLRMANYTAKNVEEAKQVFYLPPAMYRMGMMNEQRVLENFRTSYPKAVSLLNREDRSLVYQAGTLLPYYITKSDSRCFPDTFLEFYVQLSRKYTDKETFIKVLKASGFRYIVIDLNLPQADETPEQNLRKKFDAFMNVLYRNPQVELLVTDRKVRYNDTGEEKYAVFLNNAQVLAAGSFALYEIK